MAAPGHEGDLQPVPAEVASLLDGLKHIPTVRRSTTGMKTANGGSVIRYDWSDIPYKNLTPPQVGQVSEPKLESQ